MKIDLSGRVAVVTGVSRKAGIGAAIAQRLAEAGAAVCTTYYRPYDVETALSGGDHEAGQIVEELRHMGVDAVGLEADLADPNAPAQIFDAAVERFGQVDILVNNATRDLPADIFTIDRDTMDAHYAVNIRGALLLCQEFARRFKPHANLEESGGRIINMTSGQGLGAMPNSLPYVASKGAIEALTISLSGALSERGITVNAVDPGATDTGWMSDSQRSDWSAAAPLGRVGLPDDAARLICFLASAEGRWITGQILRSRGGS